MEKQTAGRDNLGKLAPKFAELNDDVLFGEVWSRKDKLSLRDRSMITISALMAQGLYPQVKAHSFCYYDLATYKGNKGVITYNFINKDEKFISSAQLACADENIDKLELVRRCNIEDTVSSIKEFCLKNGYNYNENILSEINTLYIYDLMTLQPDRNPYNWGIIVNEQNRNIRLMAFDNGNMLHFDKPRFNQIPSEEQSEENLFNNHTLLLQTYGQNYQEDKVTSLLNLYYEGNNDEIIDYYMQFITEDSIQNIFNEIEKDHDFTLPDNYKKEILYAFKKFIENFYSRVNKKDNHTLVKRHIMNI